MTGEILLRASGVRKTFHRSGGWLKKRQAHVALDGVSIDVRENEILGIVGESGCGKSTFARVLVGMVEPDEGSLQIQGESLFGPDVPTVPCGRRRIQMVFQDPYASLNPRMRVGDIVGEGLSIEGKLSSRAIRSRVVDILALVGLTKEDALKFPHQFSGGQRQRLCIARAIVLRPKLLIADEAVSALDVSVQMQILNLLLDLRQQFGIAIIFISHDIAVIEYLCDRVVVMCDGSIVEENTASELIDRPTHSYTQKLIAAVPRMSRAVGR